MYIIYQELVCTHELQKCVMHVCSTSGMFHHLCIIHNCRVTREIREIWEILDQRETPCVRDHLMPDHISFYLIIIYSSSLSLTYLYSFYSCLICPVLPGVKGEKGSKGERGVKGETNGQGQKGEKGDIGEKGEMGDIGPTGESFCSMSLNYKYV